MIGDAAAVRGGRLRGGFLNVVVRSVNGLFWY